MANFSIKPGRGQAASGVVGGIVGTVFGLLWTILAFAITRDAPFPLVGIIFPLFGILFTGVGIFSIVISLHNATQPNRFSVYDVVHSDAEPDPLTPRDSRGLTPAATGSSAPGVSTSDTSAAGFCTQCGGALRAGDRFCGKCGRATGGAA